MAMDPFDWVAVLGFAAVIALTVVADPDPLLLSALLGGFVLALALWRFYQGFVWESVGWLIWVGAAVMFGFGLEEGTFRGALFSTSVFLGLAFLLGGRLRLLPDVRSTD